jgi:hypothetical protein
MTKYIKVTDQTGKKGEHVGYHSVEDDFELPLSTKDVNFEFVKEAEARAEHPQLFGEDAEDAPVDGAKKGKAKKEVSE